MCLTLVCTLKSTVIGTFDGFHYIIPLRHKCTACFQKMSPLQKFWFWSQMKIRMLSLKINKSQYLLFENGTFRTSESRQN